MYEYNARPQLSKRFSILFLVGIPIASFTLLATQIDFSKQFGSLSDRLWNQLEEPYRYPYADTLAERSSPIAQAQQQIGFYQEQVRRDPTSGLSQASLAIAYLQMAKVGGESNWYLLAEQSARQSLVNLPYDNLDAILVLARVAEAQHDFAGALQLAKQAEGHRDAIAIQVTSNLAMGNLTEANKAANELVDRLPSITSMTLLAMVQTAQGNDQAALQSFQQALSIEEVGEISHSARTRTLLGRFYYERGQLESAEALYREALRISPNYPMALINLAQLEIRQGNYRAAERQYAAVEATSNGIPRAYDPLILRGKARIQALRGNSEKASQFWNEAEILLHETTPTPTENTSIQPGSFGHQRDLARLLLERGNAKDIPEALSLIQAEVKNRRDADTLDTLAWALSQSGQWQEAQQVVKEAIAKGTRDAAIFHRAGTIEQAIGNSSLATQYFQQAQEIDPSFDESARHATGLGAGLGS
jgi:tetratricopeptide (TPR) repeat protein